MKNKIEQENNEMLRNQIKEAQHHSSELKSVVSSSTQVEPWVVAKMERATTDLSDIAHYLDGRKDMMKQGGLTPSQEEKVAKVMHEFKEGELHSGSKQGPVVTNRKQAIAIALAEANAAKKMSHGGYMFTGSTMFKDGGNLYSDLQNVGNWKFTNGYGFIFEHKGKKIGFLAYNSGDESKKYSKLESLNISQLKNLTGIVDNSIVLHIQAYYLEKAHKITKMELSGKHLSMVIITDHNVDSFEVYTQNKTKKSSGGSMYKDGGPVGEDKIYLIGRPEVDITGRFNKKRYTFKKATIKSDGSIIYDQVSFSHQGSAPKGKTEHGIIISIKEFNDLIKKYSKGGNIEPGMMAWKGNKSYTVVRFDNELQRWVLQSTTSGMEIMPKESELSEYEFQQSGNSKMEDGGNVKDKITNELNTLLEYRNKQIVGSKEYDKYSERITNLKNKLVELSKNKMKDGGPVDIYSAKKEKGRNYIYKNGVKYGYLHTKYYKRNNKEIQKIVLVRLSDGKYFESGYTHQNALYSSINATGELPIDEHTIHGNSGSMYKDGGDVNSRFSSCEKWWDSLSTDQRKKIIEDNDLQFATTNDFDGLTTRGENELKTVFKKVNSTKYDNGGNVEGDLTKLSNLEKYVNAHKAEIKTNRKTYGFMSVAKITNPYDFSSLLGVDSRIFRNAEIPYYAKFVASLLK